MRRDGCNLQMDTMGRFLLKPASCEARDVAAMSKPFVGDYEANGVGATLHGVYGNQS